ncbi:unnamed protein product [Staurois parvus]|uniref:Uncharacterized protein n=1 Tax=Staurois parvus TaxID=386267 RepID=A0ABN9FJU3_9NEOB|nr:unnamed protein product [Staurois parvus]
MGPLCLAQTQKSLLKRYQRHLMGPPTDPGSPSSSARVSKWSVRPHCLCLYGILHLCLLK